MARFSVCGGDDGEGPSNNHRSRKRQRLPSIDEDDEDNAADDSDSSDARSSGEENEEETRVSDSDNNQGGSTSDDSDREVVIEERRFGKSVNTQSSSASSSSTTTKDSPLSVTLLDPDVLDCPICCEPLKIPIFQCDNGHLACSLCCVKVRNRCPSCTLPIGYIRCRAMEKVIEASRVSCPNAKYGCKENTSYGNRFSHEKLCDYTPCTCPVVNCDYSGYYKDLYDHVRANHKDAVIPFAWDIPLDISLEINEKTRILQEEKDGEVIVVQVFRALHAVFVSVSCVAPLASSGVGKLSCSLVKMTVDGLLKQGFMVKNIQKVRNLPPEDGFMLLPNYLLSGNVNFDLQIWIGRGRLFVHT